VESVLYCESRTWLNEQRDDDMAVYRHVIIFLSPEIYIEYALWLSYNCDMPVTEIQKLPEF
jgi:hypothetical protein